MGESSGNNFDFSPAASGGGALALDPISGVIGNSQQQGSLPGGGIDKALGRNQRSPLAQIADPGGFFLKGPKTPVDFSAFEKLGRNAPTFTSGLTPGQDSTSPQVAQALGNLQFNQQASNRLRQEALRQGPSRFTRLRAAQLPGESAAAAAGLQQQAAGQAADTRASLAARGGLTGGAAERIAEERGRATSAGLRGVAGQQASQLGQLALADEQSRQAGLGSQFGRELQLLDPQFKRIGIGTQARQFDVGQKAAEAARKSAFDLGVFQSRQKALAGLAQAKATAADQGKK